jgi:hypothetical protein
MAALYQLSYVGANQNPSVTGADRAMIPAPNDHKCPVVPGGVFLAVLGAFQGRFCPRASPSPSRQAPKAQSGRDLADKETSLAIHGKAGVRGSNPLVGSPSRYRDVTAARCILLP